MDFKLGNAELIGLQSGGGSEREKMIVSHTNQHKRMLCDDEIDLDDENELDDGHDSSSTSSGHLRRDSDQSDLQADHQIASSQLSVGPRNMKKLFIKRYSKCLSLSL